MTTSPDNRAAPSRSVDPGAKTVCLSAAPTPPVLPTLPDEPPAGMVGRPDPSGPLAYTLLLPCKSGAVFFQHRRSLVLPLFTDWNIAGSFLVRTRMRDCWILELPTAGAVADFLRSPPGRFGGTGEFLVSVDPADVMGLGSGLVPARELIDTVTGGSL